TAGELFLDRDDEIIIPTPYWENYDLMFLFRKGVRVKTFDLFAGGGFNWTGLAEALQGPAKSVLLLNFPNNPTGYTPTSEEAERIVEIIRAATERGKGLVVLVDDAYFGLVYEPGVITESLFSRLADLHERVLAVKLDGPTKEDYVWGFRIGFITYGSAGRVTSRRFTAPWRPRPPEPSGPTPPTCRTWGNPCCSKPTRTRGTGRRKGKRTRS
ncbi:MAG: aminotransferase class I/II-fold pyridoxal phosphate-dependent enzyme, partial [Deltaproteobacteria bacterium]|nr:aminotransferase class I/II-fold pyridoxal phosphate-dependent enzyme [Deltaproteobacteria bacterium]